MPTDDRITRGIDESIESMAKAKQVHDLLMEIRDEIDGLAYFMRLVERVLKERFPEHKAVRNEIKHERGKLNLYAGNMRIYVTQYRNRIYDFEHRFGKVAYKRLAHLSPITMTLMEILDEYGYKDEEVDFLDEPGELHRSRYRADE